MTRVVTGHRHAWRDDPRRTQAGDGRPHARRGAPHLHPGLGLWDWETVRVCCVGPQAVMFVMAATGDSYGFLVMVLECHVFLPHWKQVLA